MIARNEAPQRLLVVGLGLHVVAIAALCANILTSRSEAVGEAHAEPASTPAPRVEAAPEDEQAMLVPALAPAAPLGTRTALVRANAQELSEAGRVTADLARVLLDPQAEDDLWAEQVQSQALTLDRTHEPALEAILADAGRSVEEHVAASELLDALRSR